MPDGYQHHPAPAERVQRQRRRNAERRGGGGAIGWSTGAGELTMAEIRADYARYCKWNVGELREERG